MISAMDQENRENPSIYALPDPTDTPYRTPLGGVSRNGSPSPELFSSPPLPPIQNGVSRSRAGSPDVTVKESISTMDPRRFTPTLHASLVGEILSLRRDLENKTKDINHLEDVLHTTKAENEHLTETLQKNTNETRTLKKQMQLLEGGTLSALDELAKERDEALGSISDMRRRLDHAQKKARTHEEDAEKIQRLYESDKSSWESEKRALETKVHIVEGRLKVVLSEVAASQEANPYTQSPRRTGSRRSAKDGSIRSESAASILPKLPFGRRRASTASSGTHSPQQSYTRISRIGPANGAIEDKAGVTLADELAFSEDEGDVDEDGGVIRQNVSDDEDDDRDGEDASPGALPEERSMSRLSDIKARKLLGLSLDAHQGVDQADLEALSLLEEEPEQQANSALDYADSGTQYSPPTTPVVSPRISPRKEKLESVKEENLSNIHDVVANQGRKRITSSARDNRSMEDLSAPTLAKLNMISTSCQTTDDLSNPPNTAEGSTIDEMGPRKSEMPQLLMLSKETQTELTDEPSEVPPSSTLWIPKITIEPPSTRPSTPRQGVVLPPHTRNASSQVSLHDLTQIRSIGIQTEEIRVDSRTMRLPPHLMPSAAIMSRIPEREQVSKPLSRKLRSPPPVAPTIQSLKRSDKHVSRPKLAPALGDSGPVINGVKKELKFPERSSSLFAGFDDTDEIVKVSDQDDVFDDDEFFSRPTASYTLKGGKLVTKRASSFDQEFGLGIDEIEQDESSQQSGYADIRLSKDNIFDDYPRGKGLGKDGMMNRPPQNRPKPLRLSSSSKSANIRRAALISSGAAAHQVGRARSPSLPSENPPFPVPTRHSSRKIPISSSDGARSPTAHRGRLSQDDDQNVRRSRSAAALPHQERHRSRSPPTISSATIPESPSLPPMPIDQVSPFGYETFRSPDLHRWSSHIRDDSVADSANTTIAQTTVVDAIAQTMVGEWMWKYVRRTRTFGTSNKLADWDTSKPGEELSANITNSGERHRRWVWLAPYERAIMWSSKQPTTGPALLGKSGRKCRFGFLCGWIYWLTE